MKQLWRAAWHDLWRSPAVTLVALLAAVLGDLGVRLTIKSAAMTYEGEPLLAVTTVFIGLGFAGLLVDVARAAALSAYAGATPSQPSLSLASLWVGARRAPAMIAVRAVELTIDLALGLGALMICGRLADGAAPPQRLAALGTLTLGPALALALTTFAAARVAQTLVARGCSAAEALVHGYDFALRRLAVVARFALVLAPFGLALALLSALLPPLASAAVVALAVLWAYAALSRLVGKDPRLALG
jgi:hypothetical protein